MSGITSHDLLKMVYWCCASMCALCCCGAQCSCVALRSLFIPLSDRSSWDQLTARTVQLLRQLLAACPQDRVTLVGESVRTLSYRHSCASSVFITPLPAVHELPRKCVQTWSRKNSTH